MSQPVRVGSIDVSERELFLLSTPSIRNPGGDLDLSSKYFGVLLVCDAERVENALIAQLADSLLAQGMRYFCSWGNDCERVHT
jgi:hypothetical protein